MDNIRIIGKQFVTIINGRRFSFYEYREYYNKIFFKTNYNRTLNDIININPLIDRIKHRSIINLYINIKKNILNISSRCAGKFPNGKIFERKFDPDDYT